MSLKEAFLLSAIGLLLVACNGEWDTPLVGDYRWIGLDGRTGAIVGKDGDIAVYPNVVTARADGPIVYGQRTRAESNSDNSAPFTSGLGYFVLDSRSGRYRDGISEQEMKSLVAVWKAT